MNLADLKLFVKHHLTDRPYTYPAEDHETGVVSLGLDLTNFYNELLSYKKYFDVKKISEVKHKGDKLPIYKIQVNKNSKKKLFILSGTHGNEQAGILAVLKLLKDVKNNKNFYEDLEILIVAPHNPVGAKYFSRFNGDGFDMNRDFKNLKTHETHTVAKLVKEFKPDFMLSLHEGPQEKGMFVYSNKLVEKQFALDVLDYVKKNNVALAPKSYFKNKLKTPGYLPVTGALHQLVKAWSAVLHFQASEHYAFVHGIPSITVETPWRSKDKEERLNGQLYTIKGVVFALSSSSTA